MFINLVCTKKNVMVYALQGDTGDEYKISRLHEGLSLYNLGNYLDAITYLNSAIEYYNCCPNKKKERALAYNAKGMCLTYLENLDKNNEAIECFEEVTKIFLTDEPKTYDEYYLLALAWYNWGYFLGNKECYEESIKYFDNAIECFNNCRDIKDPIDLANTYRNKGFAIAVTHYYAEESSYVKEKSTNSNYEEAIKCLDKAKQIAPKFALMWNTKGYIHTLFGDYEEAIKCYDKAIEIDPQFALALRNKGYAQYSLGRKPERGNSTDCFKEAMKCFSKSLKIDPENPYVWYYKGHIPFGQEKYEEAIKCFEISLEKDPNYADAWNKKGLCLDLLGRYQEAIKCFEKAIENYKIDKDKKDYWKNKEYKKLAYTWYSKGVSLISSGGFENYANAIGCFDRAIEIYKVIEEKEEREENKFIEIYHGFALVYYQKGYSLGNLECYKEAIKYFDKAVDYFKKAQSQSNSKDTNREISSLLANTLRNTGFANYKLARESKDMSFYKKALKCFGDAIDTIKLLEDPETANSALALAYNSNGYCLLYFLKGDEKDEECLNNAMQLFEKSIRHFREHDDNIKYPQCNMGFNFYCFGKRRADFKNASQFFLKAIDCYDKALSQDPKYADAWYGKGVSILEAYPDNFKKYEEAIKCFDEAIECFKKLFENVKEEYQSFGPTYNRKEKDFVHLCLEKCKDLKYEEAKEWCYRAQDALKRRAERKEEYQNFAAAYNRKGIVLYELARYEDAIVCFSEATIIQPNFLDAWINKGIVLNRLARYEQAIKCFDESIECFKNIDEKGKEEYESYAEALYNKGYALYSLEKYDDSLGCFNDAEKYFDKDTKVLKYDFYILRGQAKYNLRKFSEAAQDFEKINDKELGDDGQKKGMKYNDIGICYYELGRMFDDKAESSYREAIGSDSKLIYSYHYNLAVLYNRQNKKNKAKEKLDACLKVNETFRPAREANEKLGGYGQADWYNWWFEQGRFRRALGIMLILSILSPFSVLALMLYASIKPEKFAEFISNNITWLTSAATIIIGILVGVLLLPSLQKFKVGGAIEFQTIPSNANATSPIELGKPSILKIEYPNRMPISKYSTQTFRVPVRLDIPLLYISIEIPQMPKKYNKFLSL